jgi:hypothetical protein
MLPTVGLIIAVILGMLLAFVVIIARRGSAVGGVDPDSYPFSAP